MSKNVLVMGGSAFNGRAAVKALAEAGHAVTVCNRGRTAVDHPDGVTTLVADRTDHDAVRAVLGGTEWDAVLDMTAYHPEDTELMTEIFDGNVGHYIFVSSCVIYASVGPDNPGPISEASPVDRGPEQFEYGLHKLLCEDQLIAAHAETGFPATIVPLGMVFGPHNALPGREQRMFSRMLLGRPILMPGDGSSTTVVGHVDDQARAYEALLGVEASFGKRLNLTGDDPHTTKRYIDTFAQVVGVEPNVVSIPDDLMNKLWDREIKLTPPDETRSTMDIRMTPDARETIMRHIHKMPLGNLSQRLQVSLHRWDSPTIFSIDAMKATTGWAPQHTFDSTVEATYEWWRGTELHATTTQDYTYEDEILALLS